MNGLLFWNIKETRMKNLPRLGTGNFKEHDIQVV